MRERAQGRARLRAHARTHPYFYVGKVRKVRKKASRKGFQRSQPLPNLGKVGNMSRENNRANMPMVTAFIDSLRAEFGIEEIDNVIRRGLHPECKPEHRFYAAEGSHVMGCRYVPEGHVVSVSKMMLVVVEEEDAGELATATRKRGRYR